MGILNKYFGSAESRADEMLQDEEYIRRAWQQYRDTVDAKSKLIETIKIDYYTELLPKIKELLSIDLVDIEGEDKTEEELISDLDSIRHDKRLKKIERIYECLNWGKSQFEYVHKLLEQLHNILMSQMQIVAKLQTGATNPDTLIINLKLQSRLEQNVVEKITKDQLRIFQIVLLIKGVKKIIWMESDEKRILQKMHDSYQKIFSQELTEGMTYEWVYEVIFSMEKQVAYNVEKKIMDARHNLEDVEFVNSHEFVTFVRKILAVIRAKHNVEVHPGQSTESYPAKLEATDQMINVFVHEFREWWNYHKG